MGIFTRKQSKIEIRETTLEDLLLGSNTKELAITKNNVLEIPMVRACVDLIGNKVASLPIKLYQEVGSNIIEVKDNRIVLLNDDCKDIISTFDLKKNLITDYILDGKGYAYIELKRNKVESLRYVDNTYVTVLKNFDPIFKDAKLSINGKSYDADQFIKLLQSNDGITGEGIINRNNLLLSCAYYMIMNKRAMAKTSNVPKGVLESAKKLSEQAIQSLKQSWRNLYSQGNESAIILNEGITYKAISTSNQQSQTFENTELINKEICSVFGVPYELILGRATEEMEKVFMKNTVMPLLTKIEQEFNKNLLLESEKEKGYFFSFDLSEALKDDIQKRFDAYSIGITKGFLTVNECRYMENMQPLDGMDDFVKLNLSDVLFDYKNKQIFTPNTGQKSDLKSLNE